MSNSPNAQPGERHRLSWLSRRPVRYPDRYVWFVFFSAIDVMLTWAIIAHDGEEANPIARFVIAKWELPGAIAFKFSLMIFVIGICEMVGRRNDRAGGRLALVAVIISVLPVVYSLGLLVVVVSAFNRLLSRSVSVRPALGSAPPYLLLERVVGEPRLFSCRFQRQSL